MKGEDMEVVTEYWLPIGAAIFAAYAFIFGWLHRLQAATVRNQEGILRLEEQRKEDVKEAKAQRDKVDTKLDHISDTLNQVRLILENKADRG